MLTFTNEQKATFNRYKQAMKNDGAGCTSEDFRKGMYSINWQDDRLMVWFREPISDDLAAFMAQQGFMKIGDAFVSRIMCGYEDVLKVAASLSETSPKVNDFFAVFKDEYFIRLYGVTEIFVVDGLLHTTSNFPIPPALHVEIATHIGSFGIPCE